MKLQVGHFQCPVMPFPEGMADALGRCGDYTFLNKRIRIREDMVPTEQAETLLHELLHACYDAFGWPEEMTEEQVCTRLAKGLSLVLQANPELHGVLHQALTNGKAIV